MSEYKLHQSAAALVRDAGGELVGRTRLQKVAYLTQLAGFADDFQFDYRHFGPFSEELAEAMEIAAGLRFVVEEERHTEWGGWYSIYKLNDDKIPRNSLDETRRAFVSAAAKIGAIELELAATAAFLHDCEGYNSHDGRGDPWKETERRKPSKAANGRLEKAKDAYRKLARMSVPRALPELKAS